MDKRPVVLLFTASFPFGTGEAFLENEIRFAAKFVDFIIFPRILGDKPEILRELPENVKVIQLANDEKELGKISTLFKNFWYVSKVLFFELKRNKKSRGHILKNLRSLILMQGKAIKLGQKINEFKRDSSISNCVYYSYWMNDWALALAYLKDKGFIDSFVFRVLGFDIYDERRPGNYMPFRNYIYSMTKKVFAVSLSSMNYIKSKNIYSEKIELAYLGITDYGINLLKNSSDKFVILSCSNLFSLKRVHLIAESLKFCSSMIHWVHIGSGDEEYRVKQAALDLPPNITFDIIPRLPYHKDLIEFYRSKSIHLFLHVSETEGLGVVLLEALSFGIPVFTTNVGGASEFISEKNGMLFPVNFNPKHLAEEIDTFLINFGQNQEFRNNVKQLWKETFEQEFVYQKFYDQLLSNEFREY